MMNEKKNWALNLTVCVLLMAGLSPVAGAQVTVPNVFENGKVADANEVNENFKALADGINSLPAGAKGEKGDTGADGAPGQDGEQGVPGQNGAAGASCSVGACTAFSLATLSCGDTSVQIPCNEVKTVFLTSETYTGDLGGLSGADEKCNALASDAGLDGTYKAWLSDSTGSPSTRFTQSSVPYALVDGVVIANDWEDLVDGTLLSPINVTELGEMFNLSSKTLFTNTTVTGGCVDCSFSATLSCNDWQSTTTGLFGGIGLYDVTGVQWTEFGITACFANQPLYCFEQ